MKPSKTTPRSTTTAKTSKNAKASKVATTAKNATTPKEVKATTVIITNYGKFYIHGGTIKRRGNHEIIVDSINGQRIGHFTEVICSYISNHPKTTIQQTP